MDSVKSWMGMKRALEKGARFRPRVRGWSAQTAVSRHDGTLAADYYAAMAQVEGRLALPEDAVAAPPSHGELLALVDSLRGGTLNEAQTNAVCRIRIGVMALAEHAAKGQSVTKP
jgi:hypothetical protein